MSLSKNSNNSLGIAFVAFLLLSVNALATKKLPAIHGGGSYASCTYPGNSMLFANSDSVIKDDQSGHGQKVIWACPTWRHISSLSRVANKNIAICILDNGDLYHITPSVSGIVDSVYYVSNVAFYPNMSMSFDVCGPNPLYLCIGQVYSSHDMGYTWSVDTVGLTMGVANSLSYDIAGKVYACNDSGIYRKDTSLGSSWVQVTSFPSTRVWRIFVDRQRRIFVSHEFGADQISLSTDHGLSWNIDTMGLSVAGYNQFTDDVFGNVYALGNGALILKSDGGTGPWHEIQNSLISFCQTTAPKIIGDSALFAHTYVGIYESKDGGGSWIDDNSKIYANGWGSLIRLNNGRMLMGTNRGAYYSDFATNTWNRITAPGINNDGIVFYYDKISNTIVSSSYTGSYTLAEVTKSTDNGNTWTPDTAGTYIIPWNQLFGSIYIDEVGVEHIYNATANSYIYNVLYKKVCGASVITTDTVGLITDTSASVTAISSDHNGYLYASGDMNGEKMLRRPILGTHWMIDSAGLDSVVYFTKMVGEHRTVVGTNNKSIFYRGALSWQKIPLPAIVDSTPITDISIDSTGKIFAAFGLYDSYGSRQGHGIYHTIDYGTTWVSDGLDSVYAYKLYSDNKTTFALTHFNLGYILGETFPDEIIGPHPFNILNTQLDLRCAPNPFKTTTSISFTTMDRGKVELEIRDITGKRIATLINEEMMPGQHSVEWNASDFPQGIFIGILHVDGKLKQEAAIKLVH